MNDEQIRITSLTEMFLGLGHEPTPERIAYYARLLVNVPTRYIRVACDHAVVKSKSGFAPSPGEIIDQAERIHRELREKAAREHARQWSASVFGDRQPSEADVSDPNEVGKLIDMALRRERA